MGRKTILGLIACLAWSVLLPSGTKAEMYVEGYAGYVKTATVFRDYLVMTTHHPSLGTYEEHHTRGTFRPSVIGGVKVGTWFTQQGFLGASYPEWMKYLGFYLDCSYHPQNFRTREGNSIIPGTCSLIRAIPFRVTAIRSPWLLCLPAAMVFSKTTRSLSGVCSLILRWVRPSCSLPRMLPWEAEL